MSNIAPISYPVSVYADENGVIAVRVIFQDSDLSDVHSLALNTTEMLGSGTVVSDDTFHYDPGTAFDYLAAGETASDTFSYTVTDSAGESSTSTITITITGQNDGPVAAALAVQTDENTAIIVSPDFIDPDTNDTHTFTVDTTATLGSVTVNVDGTFSYDPNGMFDDLEAGETATDTFTYTVTDAAGETSTETVTVTVHGLSSNTPPTTFPVELTADEDGTIVFRITYQDPDVGDTHTYTVNTDGLLGTLTETSDGTFDYTPGAAFDFLSYGETGTDTFTYTVTDNFGGTSTSTVTLTITGQNDAPVASAMNVTTQESNPLVITPDFVDPDASDTHTFTVDTTSTTGTVTINSDGTFTYNPNGNFDDLERGETATDAFTYTVTDNSGESSTQTVTVTIQGEGDINATAAKLLASDGAEKDQFGFGTQVNDHGVVVVGSYADDDKAANSGSVYVYTPEGDGYVETKLVASDGASVDNFGRSVAVNNSGTIAVSAFHDDDNAEDSGSIYVYTPTAGGGYSEVKLTASDGVADHLLGATLSMNSDGVIAASAHGANSDRIYIFTPDGSGGYTETKLVAPGTNGFGVATLNINDNGVVFADGLGALAYVFTPDGSGGYTQLQLSAPDSSETFGIGGAVENDGTIVVGSEGAIYIYEPDGSGNYIISKMMTGSGTGRALSINESGIIVAGSIEGNGAAYVYIPDGSGDYQELVLTAFDGAVNDNFGRSVSINEDGVITIGAYGDDDNGSYSGSVSIFTPDADGNYVGPDGTIYQPTGTPVIETFDATELVITGTDAAEVLMGGNAADTIKGNGGDDSISGGAGDDQLTGGDGNDTFVFKAGNAGHDTVLDFTTGVDAQDLIELDAALFADYDAVLAAAHESGADTVITIDAETSVTLKGIQISDLDQSDFSFL
ncbi:Poly(beta-D-mannuronate) C5 epimerase 5 [Pseudovibrio axinellae]|uniref:Poly(Beta-D-mannuronate) C5 epimerase 5 n=1 Tax=Pseudovibrio axinellae TaxID=989403 RepID=A0A166A2U8_9HYPH|nr:VCBS domain-containing protein [Pseudovibrio axinellae]KZL20574.1 Poly(beta-D-mannuronate) C5 epimerase 5 [Pseudovibrio axinellae]